MGSLKSVCIREKMSQIFNRARARKTTSIVKPRFADTIADRAINAGWLLSEMDIAGGDRAYQYVNGRAVTVGLEAMQFNAPVYIGDSVTIYTEVIRQGRSSVAIKVEAFAESRQGGNRRKVTEGTFTFVHIDEHGRARAIEGKAPFGETKAKAAKPKASATDTLDHEPELEPGQELSLRTVPHPRDKNANGDIFGGWILDKMDEAGGLRAMRFARKTTVPRAIDAMTFHKPVSERNEVSFYTQIERVGDTSVTIRVEAWALREDLTKYEKVTEGTFVYVAIDKELKPVSVKPAP